MQYLESSFAGARVKWPREADEIDRLAKWAYVRYHFRPSFLLKATLKVRSFKEFKRKFFGFMEMVFSQEKESRRDEGFMAYHEEAGRMAFYRKIAKFKL